VIKEEIKTRCSDHHIHHATIEFETESESCELTECGTRC
jgi:hypothetical protein